MNFVDDAWVPFLIVPHYNFITELVTLVKDKPTQLYIVLILFYQNIASVIVRNILIC